MHSRYSLEKRLIVYISLLSVVLGCVFIFSAYRIALEEINEILDAQMQSLAERVASNHPEPVSSPMDLKKKYSEEDLFVDIWSYQQPPIESHSHHVLLPRVEKAGFYQHQTPFGPWLTYIIPQDQLQIQVSQQKAVRQELALELASSMFIPYLFFIPFAVFALGYMVRKNFKPLDDFKVELAQRKAQQLDPIQLEKYPLELEATIEEMNRLFDRISVAQAEQRQFVADAAHELRTPLTALNLQLQILLAESPQRDALTNLHNGVLRLQHLVSQLLSLAKQEALPLTEPLSLVSLNQITVECVEELIQLALQKDIDLGVEQDTEIHLYADPSALHSILYNLIDNAIKYTPPYGVVNVLIQRREQDAVLTIEDSGLGIDASHFQHIRQRFYRIHHHQQIGSGLGLSIVDRATARLGGSLSFSSSESLGGLRVEVSLPFNRSHNMDQTK